MIQHLSFDFLPFTCGNMHLSICNKEFIRLTLIDSFVEAVSRERLDICHSCLIKQFWFVGCKLITWHAFRDGGVFIAFLVRS